MKHQLTLFLSILSLWGGSTQAASIYTSGHGDFGIGYNGGFELHYHLHSGAVVDGVALIADDEYDPGDLIVTVGNITEARPVGAGYNFIGVAAGTQVWNLPQIENVSLPFFGLGSEELDPLDFVGSLTLKLTAMSGPGAFSMWDDNGGSPISVFATSDGITGADSLVLTPGGHDHYNWTFTQWGLYELTFEVSGEHGLDGIGSDTATYSFYIVPEPSRAVLLVGSLIGLTLRRNRRLKV
jgi:surface-anchored protein